jgi:mannose-6-phosphate isomerase-like protein (cupin superfamily)
MLKAIVSGLALAFAFGMPAEPNPTAAIFVPVADVRATLKKAPPSAVTDQAIRMVDLGGLGYSVGISVVSRPKTSTQGGPVEHSKVTEIYHVISGSATIVTGGKLIGGKPRPADAPEVINLNGPSMSGTSIQDGETREIAAGDAVIVPAGVNHWFTNIHESLTYLVVRIDPGKIVKLK